MILPEKEIFCVMETPRCSRSLETGTARLGSPEWHGDWREEIICLFGSDRSIRLGFSHHICD